MVAGYFKKASSWLRQEFNGGVRFVIGLTIFGNFCMYMHYIPLFGVNSVVTVIMSFEDCILKIYEMIIIRHYFSV